MTEPSSPGWQSRSFTGEAGQIRDRYTALCPEPVMRATLVSSESLRTMPTSPDAREHAHKSARAAMPVEMECRKAFPFSMISDQSYTATAPSRAGVCNGWTPITVSLDAAFCCRVTSLVFTKGNRLSFPRRGTFWPGISLHPVRPRARHEECEAEQVWSPTPNWSDFASGATG